MSTVERRKERKRRKRRKTEEEEEGEADDASGRLQESLSHPPREGSRRHFPTPAPRTSLAHSEERRLMEMRPPKPLPPGSIREEEEEN